MILVLASASPRRADILRQGGYSFVTRVSQADENIPAALSPAAAVRRLARRKGQAVDCGPGEVVLAADTVVVCAGQILGKPENDADATRMLRLLSGRTHHVYTGVYITDGSRETLFYERSAVTFYPLSPSQIEAYVRTREPLDKAGGYAIQGRGALLVRRVAGDYLNIVGLPLARTAREFEAFGF